MRRWLFALALTPFPAHGQPCCEPITAQGRQLERFLDDSGVDHLWLAGWHIDWRTGAKDRTEPGGAETKSHCSAFVAAMAERLRIYVLRPPEHRQELLANAQMRWLRDHGAEMSARLIEVLLDTLDALEVVARRMHPPRLEALMATLGDHEDGLRAALDGAVWAEDCTALRGHVERAAVDRPCMPAPGCAPPPARPTGCGRRIRRCAR